MAEGVGVKGGGLRGESVGEDCFWRLDLGSGVCGVVEVEGLGSWGLDVDVDVDDVALLLRFFSAAAGPGAGADGLAERAFVVVAFFLDSVTSFTVFSPSATLAAAAALVDIRADRLIELIVVKRRRADTYQATVSATKPTQTRRIR